MHGIAYSYVYIYVILDMPINARKVGFSLFPVRIIYSYVEKF